MKPTIPTTMLKKYAALCAGLLTIAVSWSAQAAVYDESLSAFEAGDRNGQQVAALLPGQISGAIGNVPRESAVIEAALVVDPDRVDEVIRSAINAGASTESVGNQCSRRLDAVQVETLMVTTFEERTDPLPVLRKCLSLIPVERQSAVLAIAINNSLPGGVADIVRESRVLLNDITTMKLALDSSAVDFGELDPYRDYDDLIERIDEVDAQDIVVADSTLLEDITNREEQSRSGE